MADSPTPSEQAPAAGQAEIVLNEKGANIAYSNFARVTSTAEEVIIDFCLNPNPFSTGRQEIPVAQRLIMNFYTAKRFSALGMTLQRTRAPSARSNSTLGVGRRIRSNNWQVRVPESRSGSHEPSASRSGRGLDRFAFFTPCSRTTMARTSIPTTFFSLVVVRDNERFLAVHEINHGQGWYLPAGRARARRNARRGRPSGNARRNRRPYRAGRVAQGAAHSSPGRRRSRRFPGPARGRSATAFHAQRTLAGSALGHPGKSRTSPFAAPRCWRFSSGSPMERLSTHWKSLARSRKARKILLVPPTMRVVRKDSSRLAGWSISIKPKQTISPAAVRRPWSSMPAPGEDQERQWVLFSRVPHPAGIRQVRGE